MKQISPVQKHAKVNLRERVGGPTRRRESAAGFVPRALTH
jgi:hypothetical protein